MARVKKPADHSCKNMKQRCRRCFQLGHVTKDCKTFDPGRKNFCYCCSLRQVRGENVHRQGEFGSSCYMRVARDLAWMLWANGLHRDDSFHSALCTPYDITSLRQLLLTSGDLLAFSHLAQLDPRRSAQPSQAHSLVALKIICQLDSIS